MYKKQDIDKLKQLVNYHDFYSQYIPDLSKYVRVPCPIHNGTKNNFQIDFNTGIWKCYSASCGKFGDVYDFVQFMDNISLTSAIRKVAKYCNYTLEESADTIAEREKYLKVINFNNKLIKHFNDNLLNSNSAKLYLLKRFNTKEHLVKAIKEFKLGLYNPSTILDIIEDSEINIAIDIGVIKQKDDGSIYPFSSTERISIPYIENNIVKTFTFRAVDSNVDLRYFKKNNSLFEHKDLLYGYNNALEAIKKYRHAILTEGNFDVISAHLNGFRTTVGMAGSNLTEVQLSKLRNYCKVLYVVLEDEASYKSLIGSGKNKGMYQAIKKVMPFVQIKVVKMYDGNGKVDLNEYFKNHDFNDFKIKLKESFLYNEFILHDLYKNMKINNIDDKIKYLNLSKKHLLSIKNITERNIYIKKISSLLGIPIEDINNELKKAKRTELKKEVIDSDDKYDDRIITVQKVLCSFMLFENIDKQNLINLFDKYKPQQHFNETYLNIFNELMFLYITNDDKKNIIEQLLLKDLKKQAVYDIILKADASQAFYNEDGFENIIKNQVEYLVKQKQDLH